MNPLAALILLALTAAPVAAQAAPPAAEAGALPAPETPERLAARVASRRFPGARWRVAEARRADFTHDGQPDLALLGVDGTDFLLVVVEGPLGERSRVHSLRLRTGLEAEDAVCGLPLEVQANTERPDPSGLPGLDARQRALVEEGAEASSLGLVLVHARATGYCQAIHVLFDGIRLAWWRAPAPPSEPLQAGAR